MRFKDVTPGSLLRYRLDRTDRSADLEIKLSSLLHIDASSTVSVEHLEEQKVFSAKDINALGFSCFYDDFLYWEPTDI
jgi:hypothetical protein